MKFIPTAIPEVIVIEPQVFRDERGFFLETYHQSKISGRRDKRGLRTRQPFTFAARRYTRPACADPAPSGEIDSGDRRRNL